jgi:hypothetical protein
MQADSIQSHRSINPDDAKGYARSSQNTYKIRHAVPAVKQGQLLLEYNSAAPFAP